MNSFITRLFNRVLFWEIVSLLVNGFLAWLAWEIATSGEGPRTALEAGVTLSAVIWVAVFFKERKTGFAPTILTGDMPVGIEVYTLAELMYICVYFFGLGYFWALIYCLGLCFRIDILQRNAVYPESQLSRLFQGHN